MTLTLDLNYENLLALAAQLADRGQAGDLIAKECLHEVLRELRWREAIGDFGVEPF